MKRIIACLVALVMAMGCISALADNGWTVWYKSNFTSSYMDGWFAKAGVGIPTGDGRFRITNRTDDWNGPTRAFDLKAGKTYKVAVDVFQKAVPSATFMITVEQDGGNWVNLADKNVPKSTWTRMETTFKLEQYNSYYLYVETVGAPNIDFEIRNFTIYVPDGDTGTTNQITRNVASNNSRQYTVADLEGTWKYSITRIKDHSTEADLLNLFMAVAEMSGDKAMLRFEGGKVQFVIYHDNTKKEEVLPLLEYSVKNNKLTLEYLDSPLVKGFLALIMLGDNTVSLSDLNRKALTMDIRIDDNILTLGNDDIFLSLSRQ